MKTSHTQRLDNRHHLSHAAYNHLANHQQLQYMMNRGSTKWAK